MLDPNVAILLFQAVSSSCLLETHRMWEFRNGTNAGVATEWLAPLRPLGSRCDSPNSSAQCRAGCSGAHGSRQRSQALAFGGIDGVPCDRDGAVSIGWVAGCSSLLQGGLCRVSPALLPGVSDQASVSRARTSHWCGAVRSVAGILRADADCPSSPGWQYRGLRLVAPTARPWRCRMSWRIGRFPWRGGLRQAA